MTPIKPTVTALQRNRRTRSFRINAASATVINGDANWMAVASASGSRASAEKLLNMPQTLSEPRPS